MRTLTARHQQQGGPIPLRVVSGLLDGLDEVIVLAERGGRFVFGNQRAQQMLQAHGFHVDTDLNLFSDVFRVDPKVIFDQIVDAQQEVNLQVDLPSGKARARIQWICESDWLVVKMEEGNDPSRHAADAEAQHTVQELLQEREITYRNLLAAYLRLQEVNRQKTVFLASAAHELKRENDLVECLEELARRWQEGFQRKQVRLETQLEKGLPVFSFDYQKVQQAVGNLLDNALKHTPTGGSVTLRARPHFWERRVNESAQLTERRQAPAGGHNSVEVAVSDTGAGIAAEHHQEIFEDFVRVDRNTSGMGLGLAIAKRLVQAHRGKIWVDSEPQRGCTFTFLLPIDNA